MIGGEIQFKCDECGNRFKALDLELGGTILSMPVTCPECGSRHTYPAGTPFYQKSSYKKIWKKMDKEAEESDD